MDVRMMGWMSLLRMHVAIFLLLFNALILFLSFSLSFCLVCEELLGYQKSLVNSGFLKFRFHLLSLFRLL